MPFTQQDLDTLQAAMKTGATEVRFQDRTVRFQSAKDMLLFYNLAYQDVYGLANGANGASALGIVRWIRMTTDKGI